MKLSIVKKNKCDYKNKISVICCFYNAEKYIEECLNSVISQNSCDFRLMLLDDASIDRTLELSLEILAKSNISYEIFCSKENVGVPRARNSLINLSSSEFLAIHDADDVMMPNRLALQYEVLSSDCGISILGGRAIKIDDNSDFIDFMYYPPVDHDDIEHMLTGRINPMIDPSVMMTSKSFKALGGYSESDKIRLAQDFDLWIRACANGFKISNLNIPIIFYRSTGGGLTQSRKNDMIKAHVFVQSMHAEFLNSIRRKK